MVPQRPSEFELIRQVFARLATDAAALGLSDDAALIAPRAGEELAVTSDALVAGVHFRETDSPSVAAYRSLGANLSDLAAMGADPLGYTSALSLPDGWTIEWIQEFADGLAEMQRAFGITLLGGDTVRTPGPFSVVITAFGHVPEGAALTRSGAGADDTVWVSGTIGDAALGLMSLQGEITGGDAVDCAPLIARFERPEPRLELGRGLRGIASAAIDVSDGLAADLGHICRASGVGGEIQSALVPLSNSARHLVEANSQYMDAVVSGGDDYELLFTAPAEMSAEVETRAAAAGTPVTQIGTITRATAVRILDRDGTVLPLETAGFSHF